MVRIFFVSLLVLILLNACGLTKSTEQAANAAGATLDKVETSNQLQQQILAKNEQLEHYVAMTADLTAQLLDLNKQINDSTTKTKLAIHQQILGESLHGLFAPENTENLKPPTKMIPYGRSFANEATPLELMMSIDLILSDAKFGEGGILALKKKMIDLTAVGIIGGLTPLDKFVTVMHDQVDNRGEYEESAYEFAMLRYVFIRDALFLPILEKKTILNKSLVLKAYSAFKDLRHVTRLPYADRIGITVSAIMYTNNLNLNEIKTLADKAKTRFQQGLSQSVLNDPEVKAILNDLIP